MRLKRLQPQRVAANAEKTLTAENCFFTVENAENAECI
jgi:hypothetical protein